MGGVGWEGNKVEGMEEEASNDWDYVSMDKHSCWYWMIDFLDVDWSWLDNFSSLSN